MHQEAACRNPRPTDAVTLAAGITTNTTTQTVRGRTGYKTFWAEVVGTGAVTATVTIYGCRTIQKTPTACSSPPSPCRYDARPRRLTTSTAVHPYLLRHDHQRHWNRRRFAWRCFTNESVIPFWFFCCACRLSGMQIVLSEAGGGGPEITSTTPTANSYAAVTADKSSIWMPATPAKFGVQRALHHRRWANLAVISKTTAVTIGGGVANDTYLKRVIVLAALTGTCDYWFCRQ